MASRWRASAFHLLAASGAIAIVVGSYLPWATFYDGLYAPNGVSGHGRFFIGLAMAAVAALALAQVRPRAPVLRWALPLAGAIVAAMALRNLWNLNDLLSSPEAALYFVGRGPGLYVVTAGAALLIAAAALAPDEEPGQRTASVPALLARLAVVAGVALLVPGIYGDYLMHASGHLGHAAEGAAHSQGGDEIFHPDHLLTAGGAALLLLGSLSLLPAALRRAHF